jgi:type I restriction enzyme R subunit
VSQFAFLGGEWVEVFEAASKAEAAVHADSRTARFYARIHEPSFEQTAGEAVFRKARVIKTLGNRAGHSRRQAEDESAELLVRSLVAMDRAAAKEALARFTNGKTLAANQLEFVNLIV